MSKDYDLRVIEKVTVTESPRSLSTFSCVWNVESPVFGFNFLIYSGKVELSTNVKVWLVG